MKKPGRVGDTPLIGCGAYANGIGGASSTGQGGPIMRVMLSRLAVDMLTGLDPIEAARRSLSVMADRTGGWGGIIVLDRRGRIGYAHTSKRMAVAYSMGGEIVAKISSLE